MKKLIPNITFLQYTELKDKSEYNYFLRYFNNEGVDHFKLGEFTDNKFGFVKSTQHLLNNDGLKWDSFFKILQDERKLPIDKIVNTPIFILQQERVYIKEQVEYINKLESDNLGHASTVEEEAAGIEEFSKFGHYSQLRNIMTTFGYTQDQVESMGYENVFTELYYQKTTSDFQARLQSIRKK